MRKSIFTIAALVGVVFSGCQNPEGCMDPTALNYDAEVTEDDGSCVYQQESSINLKFTNMVGNQPLVYDQEYTMSSGRKVKFSLVKMYLSGFNVSGASVNQSFDSYILLQGEDNGQHEIGSLADGDITNLVLNIGVDSAHNHLDPASFPAEHPLSANQEYFGHWAWNPGYKFLVLEGRMDSTAAMNGDVTYPFIYHLGLDEIYQPIDLSLAFSADGSEKVIEINVDWMAFFNDLDFPSENDTHMASVDEIDVGHRMIDQGENVFSVQ